MQMIVRNPTQGIYPAERRLCPRDGGAGVPRASSTSPAPWASTRTASPAQSLAEQLDLIWRNIRTILASADMTVDNIVRLTSYLRDPAYAEENAKARVKALNGRVIPTIGIVAQTLSSDWLVEIEVIAAA